MNLHWNRRKCFCLLAAAAILTILAVVLHAAQKPVCKKLAEGTPAEARLTILEGERPGPRRTVLPKRPGSYPGRCISFPRLMRGELRTTTA